MRVSLPACWLSGSFRSAIFFGLLLVPALDAAAMETVAVDDPGNVADTRTGFGAVSNAFRIGKYEVKNSEYAAFLNAVDPDGSNTGQIYSASMASEPRGGIVFTATNAPGLKYVVKDNMANKPVLFVHYYSTLRFANWMHHGATSYASSVLGAAAVNDGAHTLNGATAGPVVAKNAHAIWWLPSEDEWYKAAYYKGYGTNAGYWLYATQSDTKPGYSSADVAGNGSAGGFGNFANTDRSAGWNGQDGHVTTVGSNGGPGAYGTFDQNGNVRELCNTAFNSFQAVARGGSWNISSPADVLVSTNRFGHTVDFEFASGEVGFRLAGAPVPPPSPDPYSIFIHDGDALGMLSFLSPGEAEFYYLGKMGTGATGPGGAVWTNTLSLDRLSMMDIVWSQDNQTLFALSTTRPGTDNADSHLWTIDPASGAATLVTTNGNGIPGDGVLGSDGRDSFTIPNALGLDSDGRLLTAITTAPRLYEIDPASGQATEFTFSVAGRPDLKYSMGDLVTHHGRTYIALSTNRYNADGAFHLVELTRTNLGTCRVVGVVTNTLTGQPLRDVGAMAATPFGLYGFSYSSNQLFHINSDTASGSPVAISGDIHRLSGIVGAAAFTELGVKPAETSVFANGSVTLRGTGGSSPYQFTLISNPSGGTIHPFSGVYVAGSAANVTDLVRVTDAFGLAVTSTVFVLPSPDPAPDLVLASVTAPASAEPGVPFDVVYVVSNRGAATVFSSRQDYLFASDDGAVGNDVFLATRTGVDSLAPGASVTITQAVVIGVNGPAGSLRIMVAADGNSRIAEENESNNSAVAASVTAVPLRLRMTPSSATVAEGASTSLTVSRNGNLATSLAVSLLAGLPDQLTAPTNVMIPAGFNAHTFSVSGALDGVVDGTQLTDLIAGASGFSSATSTITVTDIDVETLTLVLSTNRLVEGEIGTGTISRASLSPSATTINFSGGSGRLAFPGTVTIPAGSASTNFLYSALQNSLIETNQAVNINASATGFSTAVAPVTVVDDDTPVVTITLSAFSVGESAGNNAVVGTVTRTPVSTRAVNVDLFSSLPGAAQVPVGVTIPASVASANFAVIPVDNSDIDGDRTVVISGSVLASQTGLPINNAIPANLTVTDDDGPTLRLTAERTLVREGLDPATTLAVRRNTGSSGSLVVALTSSNPGELTVPASVTIPDGTNQVTFTAASIADGVTDGNQSVIVLAEAGGFSGASVAMTVSDATLADLVPPFFTAPTNAAAGERITVEFRIENRGFTGASGFSQRISLSSDPLPGDDTLLTQTAFDGAVSAGAGFTQTLPVTLPTTTGTFWLVLAVDALNGVSEVDEANNTLVTAVPISLGPAYSVSVQADVDQAAAGTPVVLSGRATRTGSVAPAAFEIVNIHLALRDTTRMFSTLTDAAGNYSFIFEPLPGEAGVYTVGADHPAVATTAVQDTFTLSGFSAALTTNPRLTEGTTVTNVITIRNLSPVGISGLSAQVLQSSGGGFSMHLDLASTSLAGDGAVNLLAAITAPPGVGGQGAFRLQISSPEANSVTLDVPFTCDLLRSRLQASPASLLVPMIRGEQVVAQLTITNTGGRATAALNALAPPISWIRIIAGETLPALAPGETATISLLLSPPADLPLGNHTGNIVVNGADSPLYVPFTFRALSTMNGDLRVTASDELTFYAAGAPAVTNATVTLTDAFSNELILRTNFAGASSLLLTDLPEAYYEIRVESPNHTPFNQSFLLVPGTENRIDAFLPRQTVRITWTVDEIEIEDRYAISVESTFEANLPIPVITVEPSIFDLDDFPGETKQFDVTISNHGLLAAQNGRFDFQQSSRLAIEPLVQSVGTIPAMSSITIPVIFRKLPEASPRAARGGGPVASASEPAGDPNCILGGKFTHTVQCGGVDVSYSWNFKVINLNELPGFQCGSSAQSLAASSPFPSFGGNFGHCNNPPCSIGNPGYDVPIAVEKRTVCDPCVNDTLGGLVGNCMPLIPLPFNPFDKPETECGDGSGAVSQFINCMKDAHGNLSKQFKEMDEVREQLEKLGISDEDVDDAFKKAKSGLDRANKVLDVASCLAPLFDPCPFKGGAGAPGVSSERSSNSRGRQVNNLSAASLPSYLLPGVDAPPVTSELAPLYAAAVDFRKLFLPGLYLLGNPAWLQGDDQLVLTNWVHSFMQTMEEIGDEGAFISTNERNQLLAIAYPVSVDEALVHATIDRWNRSVTNWNEGRFNLADVLPGESADVIGRDVHTFLQRQANEAITNAVAKGYQSLQDQYANVYQETLAFFNQPDDGGGVCARIRLRLEQQAVLSRTAFRAVLEVGNNVDVPIENVEVTLLVKDADGNDSTSLFQVRAPELASLSAVDGSGIIPAQSNGRATWVIVPSSEAAPTNETLHFIQGTLRYAQDGIPVTIPLEPSVIRVLPAPKLVVRYFHERDVFSDDPFTLEIEPSIPYSLGILVSNEGFGVARNFRITSGQPQIIENDKGLLADFELIAAEVGGQGLSPSLTSSFGDIDPADVVMGRWLFKSSIQGLFIDYEATFEHVDGLGDKRLSLIDRLEIHEMRRVVRAGGAMDDGLVDFLVNDVPDLGDNPDTLWFSNGGSAPVALRTNGVMSGAISASQRTATLAVELQAGWNYLKHPDPANSGFRLAEVRRADDSTLDLSHNVWRTDRTFIGLSRRPRREDVLHALDHTAVGRVETYTLVYEVAGSNQDTNPPSSTISALAGSSPATFVVNWSGTDGTNGSGIAFFDVYVSVNGGVFSNWISGATAGGAVFEGEPGNTYAFYSRATDNEGNTEPEPLAAQAETTTSQANTPPSLAYDPVIEVNEGATILASPLASDSDEPAQALQFSIVSGSLPGMTLHPSTGVLNYPTGEAIGPATNEVVIRVTDDGVPPHSATATVTLVVREVNTPPSIAAIADRFVDGPTNVSFVISATDGDLPANALSYGLGAGAPAGSTIDPVSGLFSWAVAASNIPGAYAVPVVVTDNGSPPLSFTQAFAVLARDLAQTITFASIPSQFTTNRLNLQATASSGLPVGFFLLGGPAQLNGTQLSFNASGAVTVVASQPGDATWLPASSVTNGFEVLLTPAQITWSNPAPVLYGAALTETQLNAVAHIAGTFVYAPGAGEILNGGTQALQTVFTPADEIMYATTTAAVEWVIYPFIRIDAGELILLRGETGAVPIRLTSFGAVFTGGVQAVRLTLSLDAADAPARGYTADRGTVNITGTDPDRIEAVALPGALLPFDEAAVNMMVSNAVNRVTTVVGVRILAAEVDDADGNPVEYVFTDDGVLRLIGDAGLLGGPVIGPESLALPVYVEPGSWRIEYTDDLQAPQWETLRVETITNRASTIETIPATEPTRFLRLIRE